jgi:hypothetical protein
MGRHIFHFAVALTAFILGSHIAYQFLEVNTSQPPEREAQETVQLVNFRNRTDPPRRKSLDVDKCGLWSDEVDLRLLINKWLRGENLKNVPYDSKTGKIAKCFNPSNIMPTLIDVNNDRRKELALESNCSATGNCDMEIFERSGKHFRKIFQDVHGVQVFGLNETSNRGYYDLWTTMHGSADSGDMVVYRFNGKNYKPIRCFEYLYEKRNDGNGNPVISHKPTLTPFSCSRFN